VAAAPAGAEADDIPMYTLDSDNEDDLAVVSNVEQAREAQVSNVAMASAVQDSMVYTREALQSTQVSLTLHALIGKESIWSSAS